MTLKLEINKTINEQINITKGFQFLNALAFGFKDTVCSNQMGNSNTYEHDS